MTTRVTVRLVGRLDEESCGRDPLAIYCCASSNTLRRGHRTVKMAKMAHRFFLAIVANSPNCVTHKDITEILWGDDPDGGPDNPGGSEQQLMMTIRAAAAALGVVIEVVHGVGWRARLTSSDASQTLERAA